MPKSYLLGGPPPGRWQNRTSTETPAVKRSWTGGKSNAPKLFPAAAAAGIAKTAKSTLPVASGHPLDTPPWPPLDYHGDTLNDALDDLLKQAAASLKHLDGIRTKLSKDSTGQKHNDFWRPRCRADLWGESDLQGELDSDDDSDASSRDTSVGNVDMKDEGLWEFLRAACNAEPAGPSRPAGMGRQSGTPRRSLPKAKAKPRCAAGVEGVPPRSKTPPKPAERARSQGFQFGSYGTSSSSHAGSFRSNSLPVGGHIGSSPEAEVSAALLKAQAGGAESVKGTLRQLLLKWHPDKAPQGDSAEDVAARLEATRVLRHVLQEKKRLGI